MHTIHTRHRLHHPAPCSDRQRAVIGWFDSGCRPLNASQDKLRRSMRFIDDESGQRTSVRHAAKSRIEHRGAAGWDAPADMDKDIPEPDVRAWAAADERFNSELVRLGGNNRIWAIVGMMSGQVRRARTTILFMRPIPTKSNEDHRKVYQVIRDGEAVTARTCHRQHAKTILVELLGTHRLRFL